MRELIARAVCLLTLAVVVALAHVFAARHNPPVAASPFATTPRPATASTSPSAQVAPPSPVQVTPSGQPPVVPSRPVKLPSSPGAAEEIARGRALYAEQGCASCHAIAGDGNPRHPLDEVGGRYTGAELRQWITGAGPASERLSPAVLRRKQRYQSLRPDEVDSLTAYLTSVAPKP